MKKITQVGVRKKGITTESLIIKEGDKVVKKEYIEKKLRRTK